MQLIHLYHSLRGPEYVQSPHVGVFAVHVVRQDYDLQGVTIDRLAMKQLET